jgi:tRNA-dihydrouridine synthase A
VARLKLDFPSLVFVVNGGIADDDALATQLERVDGVMVGRHAYHQPWSLAGWDARFLGAAASNRSRDDVEQAMVGYMERLAAGGEPWSHASRHIVGLRHGEPGSRAWRQVWSDPALRPAGPAAVSRLAREAQARAARGMAVAAAA